MARQEQKAGSGGPNYLDAQTRLLRGARDHDFPHCWRRRRAAICFDPRISLISDLLIYQYEKRNKCFVEIAYLQCRFAAFTVHDVLLATSLD